VAGLKIACLCCTYNRPAQLAEAVESFLRQTYPAELRELVILDDAGQYAPDACDHLPGVKLITSKHRFRTLGEKRNACAALASPDVDAYAVWDDDDIYLPWHLQAMAEVFAAGNAWSLPAEVWIDRRTYLERKATKGLFHGSVTCSCWSVVTRPCNRDRTRPLPDGSRRPASSRFRPKGCPATSTGGIHTLGQGTFQLWERVATNAEGKKPLSTLADSRPFGRGIGWHLCPELGSSNG